MRRKVHLMYHHVIPEPERPNCADCGEESDVLDHDGVTYLCETCADLRDQEDY